MWVMANRASDRDIGIIGQRVRNRGGGNAIHHRESRCSRVAPAATVDAAGGAHVFRDDRVSAAIPFFESGILRARVATAADLRRDIDARARGEVHLVGHVICGWAVATLALHPGQKVGAAKIVGAFEATGQAESHSVAGQTILIGLPTSGNECWRRKRLRMRRHDFGPMDAGMTFEAGFGPGIKWRRTGNAKKDIAVQRGSVRGAIQIRAPELQPGGTSKIGFVIQLVIS